MKNRLLYSFLISILILLSIKSAASCELKLSGLNDITTIVNHALLTKSDIGKTESDNFKVISSGEPCKFFVTFEGSQSKRFMTSQAGDTLSYNLYDSKQGINSLQGLLVQNTQYVLSGNTSRNHSVNTLRYYFYSTFTNETAAGIYRDSIKINLYQGTINNYIFKDSTIVSYTVEIEPHLELLVRTSAGTGKYAILDFGTIESGESQIIDLFVTGNADYDLTLTSENHGKLIHEFNSVESFVPYTVYHNQKLFNLHNIFNLIYRMNHNKSFDDNYQLQITLGNFDFLLSGQYSDNIIFTVSAR